MKTGTWGKVCCDEASPVVLMGVGGGLKQDDSGEGVERWLDSGVL